MIYAIDFDGTICENRWPEIGPVIPEAAAAIRELHRMGHTIIIWTCRQGDKLAEALDWLRANDIPFDYANENDPERVSMYDNDSRKIGADVYIDDKNAGHWSWREIVEEARAMNQREELSECRKWCARYDECDETDAGPIERCSSFKAKTEAAQRFVETRKRVYAKVFGSGIPIGREPKVPFRRDEILPDSMTSITYGGSQVSEETYKAAQEGLQKVGLISSTGPDAPKTEVCMVCDVPMTKVFEDEHGTKWVCPKCGAEIDVGSGKDCPSIEEIKGLWADKTPKAFEEALAQVSRECDELMIRKQRDYGHGNITAFGEFGVLVRLNDKVERLKNLLTRGKEPSNEAIDDTWRDVRNYAEIALMLRRGTFTLPLEEDAE